MEWWENEREPKVVKAKWAENTSQKPLSDIFFSFLKSHQILRCSNEMRLFISGSATGTTSGSWTRLHRALEFAEAVQFAIELPSPLGDNKRSGSATLTVAQRIGCQTPSMAVFPPLKRTLLDCRTSDLTKRTIFNPKVACCGQPIDQWGSATWRPSDCRNHKGSSISRVFPQFKFWISSWYYVQFGGRFCGLCYQFQVEVIGFDLFRIFAVFQLFFPSSSSSSFFSFSIEIRKGILWWPWWWFDFLFSLISDDQFGADSMPQPERLQRCRHLVYHSASYS